MGCVIWTVPARDAQLQHRGHFQSLPCRDGTPVWFEGCRFYLMPWRYLSSRARRIAVLSILLVGESGSTPGG